MNKYLEEIKHVLVGKCGVSGRKSCSPSPTCTLQGNLSQWTKITILLGNASVDLDSAVSSLVLAFYMSWSHNKLSERVCTKKYRNEPVQNCIVIPVLNTSKEDFRLKTEVTYAFKKQHINEDQLVFREDIDLPTLSESGKLDVILVDHHVLPDNDKFLLPHVSEILDHRPKELIAHCSSQVNINIQLVGSCSTLVCEKIIAEDNGKLFLSSNFDAAFLLYSTIILDTVNFSTAVKKGTPLDDELVRDLEQILKIKDSTESRKTVLAELVSARTDVEHLSPSQLLRKDVKQIASIIVPCFPLLVEEFLQKPNAKDALDTYLRRESADAILLLGIKILANDVLRDIALYTHQDKIDFRNGIIQELLSSKSPYLCLEEKLTNFDGVRLYTQGNRAVSRKQIMPMIKKYLAMQI